jgi:succinate dehydrogenase hydrophobic anchor subunit
MELSTRELARHVLIYSVGFTLFAVEAVYGTVIRSLASRWVESWVILQVMTFLEHGMLIVSAVYITTLIVRDVWKKLRGSINES